MTPSPENIRIAEQVTNDWLSGYGYNFLLLTERISAALQAKDDAAKADPESHQFKHGWLQGLEAAKAEKPYPPESAWTASEKVCMELGILSMHNQARIADTMLDYAKAEIKKLQDDKSSSAHNYDKSNYVVLNDGLRRVFDPQKSPEAVVKDEIMGFDEIPLSNEKYALNNAKSCNAVLPDPEAWENRIVRVVVPTGYKSVQEFLDDCGIERATDIITEMKSAEAWAREIRSLIEGEKA